MGLPAGFKPNHNLSQFLGYAILDMMSVWNHVTTGLNEMQVHILWYLSFSSLLGVSTVLAVAHDFFLIVMCFHIFLPYSVVAYIYKQIMRMLQTLHHLFNGNKYNVMRQRVDANSFNIQEFYLGILIAALILFLLPTLAMYYFAAFIALVLVVLVI